MHYFSSFFQRSHLQVKEYVFKENVNLFWAQHVQHCRSVDSE